MAERYRFVHEIKENLYLIEDNFVGRNYASQRSDLSTMFVAKPWESGTKRKVINKEGVKVELEAISSYVQYLRKTK